MCGLGPAGSGSAQQLTRAVNAKSSRQAENFAIAASDDSTGKCDWQKCRVAMCQHKISAQPKNERSTAMGRPLGDGSVLVQSDTGGLTAKSRCESDKKSITTRPITCRECVSVQIVLCVSLVFHCSWGQTVSLAGRDEIVRNRMKRKRSMCFFIYSPKVG